MGKRILRWWILVTFVLSIVFSLQAMGESPKKVEDFSKLSFWNKWSVRVGYSPGICWTGEKRLTTQKDIVSYSNIAKGQSKRTPRIIILEWLGGSVCGVATSYLLTPRFEEMQGFIEALPGILLTTLVLTPLSSAAGVNIVGKKLDQNGSFLYSVIGAVLGSLIWMPYGGGIVDAIGISDDTDYEAYIIGFGLSSSIGALTGYNRWSFD